jgi:hypothetical protein
LYLKYVDADIDAGDAIRSSLSARRKTALEKDLAGNLAKAREVRMANIKAKKAAPTKKSAKKPTRSKAT